jgi:two-component system response regulator BaeR
MTVVPWVKKNLPDLILLDVMLPSSDGFEICSNIRSFSAIPIIMITSRTEEMDRLLGLDLGADDYICKPFSSSEVVARVKAVLRRARGQSTVALNGLLIDEQLFQATLFGHKLDLTPVEFKLLHILSSKPGRVYSRSQLMDMIFLDEHTVSDRTIDNHIKNIRKKLFTVVSDKVFIHSIYGVGYRFEHT